MYKSAVKEFDFLHINFGILGRQKQTNLAVRSRKRQKLPQAILSAISATGDVLQMTDVKWILYNFFQNEINHHAHVNFGHKMSFIVIIIFRITQQNSILF